jgi:glycerol kinase
LGAPHWDPYARGAMLGITRGTTTAHIARAALEGIAFQVADVIETMKLDSEITVPELKVDGGASTNDLLLQFQADLLQVPVSRPKVLETTALGAAYLAGLAVGYWKDREQIESKWQTGRTFEPRLSLDEAAFRRSRWSEALKRAQGWGPV